MREEKKQSNRKGYNRKHCDNARRRKIGKKGERSRRVGRPRAPIGYGQIGQPSDLRERRVRGPARPIRNAKRESNEFGQMGKNLLSKSYGEEVEAAGAGGTYSEAGGARRKLRRLRADE